VRLLTYRAVLHRIMTSPAGKFIPTRRTPGVSTSELLERIVKGYRRRDFDKKLATMGHAELMAQGSDFEEKSDSAPSR
jgi:choline-phosphate cytidylyltransferase